MSDRHGSFVWYELMTTDATAAATFYRGVMGWHAQDSGIPGQAYTILSVGETPVGGLMALPEEARAKGCGPGWIGYIAVNDVDAMAARVTAAKGSVLRAPDDIPSVGRFAAVADPQGAAFVLFKGMGDGPEPAPAKPGHTGWHELMAGDGERAFAFYADLFGWKKAEAMDMGAMGVYQTFTTGDQQGGGMMTKPEDVPAPFWRYYFNVDEIDAAVARVKRQGGQLLHGPMQVPGGSWIVHCSDPQRATFALVGPKH